MGLLTDPLETGREELDCLCERLEEDILVGAGREARLEGMVTGRRNAEADVTGWRVARLFTGVGLRLLDGPIARRRSMRSACRKFQLPVE